MSLKTAKEVSDYSENNDGISCYFNGKKLSDLERILSIVKSNFQKNEKVYFFEFGSQEWNPSHYGPRSGINSHFMGAGTDFPYKCFDAYSEPSDFDANVELIEGYHKAEKQESSYYNGITVKYKDPIFWKAKEQFESLSENKDLSVAFVKIRNEEYFKNFYEFYKDVNLSKMRKEIQHFSINQYNKIRKKIELSENPVAYSTNVLNAPNLNSEFNFWNIKNSFHIHSGSIRELSEKLDFDLGWKFYASNGKIDDMKRKLIDNFRLEFDLLDYNVQIQNDESKYFIFWDASKKIEANKTVESTQDEIKNSMVNSSS